MSCVLDRQFYFILHSPLYHNARVTCIADCDAIRRRSTLATHLVVKHLGVTIVQGTPIPITARLPIRPQQSRRNAFPHCIVVVPRKHCLALVVVEQRIGGVANSSPRSQIFKSSSQGCVQRSPLRGRGPFFTRIRDKFWSVVRGLQSGYSTCGE